MISMRFPNLFNTSAHRNTHNFFSAVKRISDDQKCDSWQKKKSPKRYIASIRRVISFAGSALRTMNLLFTCIAIPMTHSQAKSGTQTKS